MNETPTTPSRVLLVEDDSCTALLYKKLLQKAGYDVVHCADGQAALDSLAQNSFDAVVLDLMMPQVDGMQVLKGMRSSLEHVYTPVIILSAAKIKMLEDEAARHRVSAYLDKTQTEKLLAWLAQVIADRAERNVPKLRMAGAAAAQPPSLTPAAAPSRSAGSTDDQPKGLSRLFRAK